MTTAKPYRICLVGSGGVGTIASVVLAKSGQAHVTAVLRSKYAYVREHGWDIESVDHGELKGWRPHRVVASVEAAAAEGPATDADGAATAPVIYDYVVVCTKQLPERNPVPALIAPVVTAGHTTIVLIQNGIGIEEDVQRAWPGSAVVSSVSHIGSSAAEPNVVRQIGPDVSKMGAHPPRGAGEGELGLDAAQRRAAVFVDLYRRGGAASCELVADIATARWEKLLWNGTFNTVCALTRTDVGAIQRSRGRESLLVPMMWEIWHTAKAAGHPLPEDVVPWMAYRLPDDCPYRASMLVDLEARRPMELTVILGNPRAVAARLGVATPVMDVVHKLLEVEAWKMEHLG